MRFDAKKFKTLLFKHLSLSLSRTAPRLRIFVPCSRFPCPVPCPPTRQDEEVQDSKWDLERVGGSGGREGGLSLSE